MDLIVATDAWHEPESPAAHEVVSDLLLNAEDKTECWGRIKRWAFDLPNGKVRESYLNSLEYHARTLVQDQHDAERKRNIDAFLAVIPRPAIAAPASRS
jgi:hypothetical protein